MHVPVPMNDTLDTTYRQYEAQQWTPSSGSSQELANNSASPSQTPWYLTIATSGNADILDDREETTAAFVDCPFDIVRTIPISLYHATR